MGGERVIPDRPPLSLSLIWDALSSIYGALPSMIYDTMEISQKLKRISKQDK